MSRDERKRQGLNVTISTKEVSKYIYIYICKSGKTHLRQAASAASATGCGRTASGRDVEALRTLRLARTRQNILSKAAVPQQGPLELGGTRGGVCRRRCTATHHGSVERCARSDRAWRSRRSRFVDPSVKSSLINISLRISRSLAVLFACQLFL